MTTSTEILQRDLLDPLAEHFGPAPPNYAAQVERYLGVEITAERCQHALAAIVTTRKAKGFPSMAEILIVLRAGATKPKDRSREPITDQNYAARAVAFCGGQGLRIRRAADPQAWREWRVYFRRIGYHGTAARMADADEWFVPSPHPHDFDPSFPTLPDRALLARPSVNIGPASPKGKPWTVFPAPPESYAPGPNGSDPWSHIQPNGDPDWWFALPKEHPRRRAEVMRRRDPDFGPMQRMPGDQHAPTWKRPHEHEADEKLEAQRRLDFPLGVEDVKLSQEAASKFRAEDISP